MTATPSDPRPSDPRPSETRPSETRPTETRPSETRSMGMRFWRKALLFGSLALNMLVLGAGAALMARGGPDHADASARPAPILYYLALDRDDRRALRAAQLTVGERDPAARQDRRAAVVASLRADPFVPAAFDAALAADLAAEEERATVLRQALLRQVGAMDATARAEYARRIADFPRHGPDHDRKGKPRRD